MCIDSLNKYLEEILITIVNSMPMSVFVSLKQVKNQILLIKIGLSQKPYVNAKKQMIFIFQALIKMRKKVIKKEFQNLMFNEKEEEVKELEEIEDIKQEND